MTEKENQLDRLTQIDVWVFDLDNTLYPPSCNLFAQVDQRMGAFISDLLNLDHAEARQIQKSYYRDYGTTLHGLMLEHGIDPKHFLDFVHDIDHTRIEPDGGLAEAIEALPGRKLIFTNGSRSHAEKVASRIGILELFEGVFDIVAADYVPKPQRAAYQAFVKEFEIEPERSAMFEDLSRNLAIPAELGMSTILVIPQDGDHPDAEENWNRPNDIGDHVHHITEDLTAFLGDISSRMA